MDAGDRALLALKEQMTEEQRQDMADLLRAELERREKEKRMGSMDTLTPSKPKSKVKSSAFSDKLGPNEVGEIYGELNDQVKSLRLKQLERRLAEAKADQKRMGVHVAKRERSLNKIRGVFSSKKLPMLASMPPEVEQVVREAGVRLPSGSGRASGRIGSKNAALLLGLLALGGLKILASTGVVDATKSDTSEQPMIERAALSHTAEFPDTVAPALPSEGSSATEVVEISAEQRKLVGWSFADKQLLSQLDARRVELEHRRAALERKEAELEERNKALSEKLAELRTISSKLEKRREEKDHRYEARLEQLANVYGSMSPKEAAPLIAQLDESIALALLERMPGKRMGQILAMMKAERAVALTKRLTDRRTL